jgi:hypothetical protein
VQTWFEPQSSDTANAFLDRAEVFLKKGVRGKIWGAKILGKVIETNSFVFFLRMEDFAALLMREHCDLRAARDARKLTHEDEADQDVKARNSLGMNIDLMVSSSGWSLSTSKTRGQADIPSIVWQLQRIASLPTQLLEANECAWSEIESMGSEILHPAGSRVVEMTGGGSGRKALPSADIIHAEDDAEPWSQTERPSDASGPGAHAPGVTERVAPSPTNTYRTMSAGNQRTDGYPVTVTLTKADSPAIAFVDVDLKDAAERAGVNQPLALEAMRQKFKRQGYRHFVVVQWHSNTKEHLYAATKTFAAKLQAVLLQVQATKSEGRTWSGISLGKLLHPGRQSGGLIRDITNLSVNHVSNAIAAARLAAGSHSGEENKATGVETPDEKKKNSLAPWRRVSSNSTSPG